MTESDLTARHLPSEKRPSTSGPSDLTARHEPSERRPSMSGPKVRSSINTEDSPDKKLTASCEWAFADESPDAGQQWSGALSFQQAVQDLEELLEGADDDSTFPVLVRVPAGFQEHQRFERPQDAIEYLKREDPKKKFAAAHHMAVT